MLTFRHFIFVNLVIFYFFFFLVYREIVCKPTIMFRKTKLIRKRDDTISKHYRSIELGKNQMKNHEVDENKKLKRQHFLKYNKIY